MPIITGRANVLKVYEEAARKGWVIPCFCTENLTTTEAIIAAASEYATDNGMERIAVTLAITNQYALRSQSVYYTHTRRWDIGLKLFYADASIAIEAYPNVDLLLHLDHSQFDTDAGLLNGDLSKFSTVMYDASELPMEENILRTAEFVRRKHDEIMIEGACDEIVDAGGEQHNDITDAARCEDYVRRTGVDMVVANLGTEHRASSKSLHYYQDAACAIRDRIGHKIVLHGTSSVSNDQLTTLFSDGICKVNIWTCLERDSAPALTEFIVKNVSRSGGSALESKLIQEGYLTKQSRKDEKPDISVFTTTARQQVIYPEMKRIVRSYFEMWCKQG